MSMSHLLRALVACVSVFVASLALTHNRATAGSEHKERMTSQHAPTGEMTPEAATNLVVNRFARQDGRVTGPLAITTVHTVFARAMAVADGGTAGEATYGGPADIAEWRTSPVYMVTMMATPGRVFRPNVSTPRGHSAPSATVMTVIVDSHTGIQEGLILTPAPPARLDELGPVFQMIAPTVSSTTIASLRSIPLGNEGELIGHVYSGGHAVVGWHMVVDRGPVHRVVTTGRTYADGIFDFRLPVGSYEIAAERSNGRICGKLPVHIKYHSESEVKLSCQKATTLPKARQALVKARCQLGKIVRPRKSPPRSPHRGLSALATGERFSIGTHVGVTLGPAVTRKHG